MNFLDVGLKEYKECFEKQKSLVEKRQENKISDTVIFCSHPEVVTLGRSLDSKKDIKDYRGEVVSVDRGGRATYHSPHQIIIYPIFDLKKLHLDIKAYLNLLELLVSESLNRIGVLSEPSFKKNFKEEEKKHRTGVWVKDKKITSIGISVRKNVSYHGMAVNWDQDDKAFKGINPCGFSSSMMISVEEVLGRKYSRESFIKILKETFHKIFKSS